jgi:hypothetical protein
MFSTFNSFHSNSRRGNIKSILKKIDSSGLILWFDALDPNNTGVQPANSSNITIWKDKSGLGSDATANTPIVYNSTGMNGKPALTFTLTQWLLGNTINNTPNMTIFSVCSINPSSIDSARLISLGTNGVNDYDNNSSVGFLRINGTGLAGYRNGAYTHSDPANYNTPYLFESWFDGVNNYSTVQQGNGTSIVSNVSSGNFGIQNFVIANNLTNNNVNRALNGFISEVIVYKTTLTTVQRQVVEGYLSWKWGIQSNLPSTHPYFSAPP